VPQHLSRCSLVKDVRFFSKTRAVLALKLSRAADPDAVTPRSGQCGGKQAAASARAGDQRMSQ
jgi:hypothetical protein